MFLIDNIMFIFTKNIMFCIKRIIQYTLKRLMEPINKPRLSRSSLAKYFKRPRSIPWIGLDHDFNSSNPVYVPVGPMANHYKFCAMGPGPITSGAIVFSS